MKQKLDFLILVSIGFLVLSSHLAFCDQETGLAPVKSGTSLNTGYTYDPSNGAYFIQISMFRLYDYEQIWKHPAPDNLRFKIEGAIGGAYLDNTDVKLVANAGILALLYLDYLETDTIKPYVEAGIGGIYQGYRVSGQDYHLNFNPQAGIGLEFKRNGLQNYFVYIRAHHISNGGIGSTNRGQNSIVFAWGRYF